jgi:TRAP-type C4-dicarboxylate transport system permease small subunit
MNKKIKRAMVIVVPLLVVIFYLLAINQFSLAYSHYSWKILAAVYPLPPITTYLPIIMQ